MTDLNMVRTYNPQLINASGVQTISPALADLDLSRLRYKYTVSSEASMTEAQWDYGEIEYRRFLGLKLRYPQAALVPSKLVDKIWHAHILDTRAYREDCQKIFGQFIDHFPYLGIYGKEDYKKLEEAFEKTVELYERHFGTYPSSNVDGHAARCQDHSCHAPTSCACRTAGACK
ncbi:MAG: hypothetical protein VB958_02650 [Thalassolituus sp.]|uniref:glycine-rich domain-containing protein n=1 Tax=Thalassolituus sp. TaxID=2030822 RepID=UPI0039821C81